MLVRPDAPLDPTRATGGCSVLRDARISVARAEAVAERDPSTGPQLHGGPLLRTPTDLVSTYAELGGGDAVQAATAAAPHDGGAVVVGRTADIGPSVLRIDREGNVSAGMPAVAPDGTDLASILSIDYYGKDPGDLDRYIGYIVVPYTAQNEAGNPFHISVHVQNVDTDGSSADEPFTHGAPTVQLLANAECSYADVYRTYSLNERGLPFLDRSTSARRALTEDANPIVQTALREGLIGDFVSAASPPNFELFFLKRVRVTPVPDPDDASVLKRVVRWEDTVSTVPAADLINPETDEQDVFEGRYTTGSGAGLVEFNEFVVPTEPYAVPRLAAAHAYFTAKTGGDVTEPGGLEESEGEFSAGCALSFQGRLLYGAPVWPTLKPAFVLEVSDVGSGLTLDLHYEYDDGGVAVLGPATRIANAGKLVGLERGAEKALRVYVIGDDGEGGETKELYERVVPSATGVFVSGYSGGRSGLTFDSDEYDSGRLSDETDGPAGGPLDVVDEISEPAAVFVTPPFRPRMPTFEQFKVLQGSEVRMLAPARLAEDEGIRSYEAYVASDTGVWTLRREGDAYVLDAVSTSFGVALAPQVRADRGQSAALVPVATPIDQGLALAGTDGFVHILSGRRDLRISRPLSGLVGRVLSLAYDPRPSLETLPDGEDVGAILWALCEDAPGAPGSDAAFGGTGRSLYGYSLEAQGWICHRAVPATTDAVFFDDPELGGDGLLVVGQDGDTQVVDGSGALRATSLWGSGSLFDGEGKVSEVSPDVNDRTYDPAQAVAVRASWDHRSIAPIGQTPESGEIKREATVSHGRRFAPRAVGRGVRVSVAGFDRLHGLDVDVAGME